MDTSSPSSRTEDPLFALKARARALKAEAKAAGRTLQHAQALEEAAHQAGYRTYQAALAAAKAAGPSPQCTRAAPSWENISAALPSLPLRFVRPGDRARASVEELMRWARQLDVIATRVPEDARADLVAVIGGEVPYVFVRDDRRFGDSRYHLCDRGYDEIHGVVFTRAQLEASGVAAWQEQRGSHDGGSMFSVVVDDLRMNSDATELRQVARLLARIAILADEVNASENA